MTDSLWLPYHMGIKDQDGNWVPMCGDPEFHAKSGIVYEFWRFLELAEGIEPDFPVCPLCRDHPDFLWHYLGSL